jgi:sulfur-oxidizing protein SoxZ
MTMARALINVTKAAKRGEVVEIKALISHPMESGFRPDSSGKLVPRSIINGFVCAYNGEEIFRAEFFPAVAANPFVAFTTVATESGTLSFAWTSDGGETHTETRPITVE